MTSRATKEAALHHLEGVAPLIQDLEGDTGLRASEVYDLTGFARDIPVKDGMYCPFTTSNPDAIYRDGVLFAAR